MVEEKKDTVGKNKGTKMNDKKDGSKKLEVGDCVCNKDGDERMCNLMGPFTIRVECEYCDYSYAAHRCDYPGVACDFRDTVDEDMVEVYSELFCMDKKNEG